jgi:hypothetical protein
VCQLEVEEIPTRSIGQSDVEQDDVDGLETFQTGGGSSSGPQLDAGAERERRRDDADARRIVLDLEQDAAARHRRSLRRAPRAGPALGSEWDPGSSTQKQLPAPGVLSTPILPSISLHQARAQGEPQTGSLRAGLLVSFETVERLEQLGHRVGRDPGPGVGDADAHHPLGAAVTSTRTRPPTGVYLTAFATRLIST